MSTQLTKIACFVAILGSLLIASPSRATDKDVVERLLSDFWSTAKKNEVDAYFAGQPSRSPQAVYAYALVKSRQNDVKMALKACDFLQKIDGKNPTPLRLKTWLLLRQDKFNTAVITVGEYIQLVKADTTMDDFDRQEAYRFAGRVFAFVDGPISGKVKTSNRDAILRKIMFKIDPEMERAFKFDYKVVADKHTDLIVARNKVDQADAIEDAKIRKVQFEQLVTKENQLHEREQTVLKERRKVREAAAKEIESIRNQDALLANQQVVLGNQLLNNYNNLAWHNYLYHAPHRHQGTSHPGNNRFNYHFGNGWADDQYHWNHRWINNGLRSQVYGVRNHRRALLDRYDLANASASNQIHSLNSELKEVSKIKHRTASQKLKSLKATKRSSARSNGLRTKARSIMTYEQFPLEIERQLMLAATR